MIILKLGIFSSKMGEKPYFPLGMVPINGETPLKKSVMSMGWGYYFFSKYNDGDVRHASNYLK